ncbi:hypothetical protein Sjap_016919 [Stephania japonica]|uniref:RRM domain-containing protein n=1 Tax=Stephania japonica TaxID=461633 RepID=A0AAP0I566_9MAGN
MAGADVEYRCFVGGLAWATDDHSLEKAFSQYGEILESKIISDRETGRSRGFGFVTFASEQAMRDAIESMNGQDLDGRNITVNEAVVVKAEVVEATVEAVAMEAVVRAAVVTAAVVAVVAVARATPPGATPMGAGGTSFVISVGMLGSSSSFIWSWFVRVFCSLFALSVYFEESLFLIAMARYARV